MTAPRRDYQTVGELLRERQISVDQLVQESGVERRVIVAIAHQRYTPSPQQRQRVSQALDFPRQRIVWGHANIAEEYSQMRL